MDGKMLARLGAIIFIAIAITATVIEMTRKEEPAQACPARALQPPQIRCTTACAAASSLGRAP